MIFLVDYDRRAGLQALRAFRDEDRAQALDERLELELRVQPGNAEREIVLLEAADFEVLRALHRRYFEANSVSDSQTAQAAQFVLRETKE